MAKKKYFGLSCDLRQTDAIHIGAITKSTNVNQETSPKTTDVPSPHACLPAFGSHATAADDQQGNEALLKWMVEQMDMPDEEDPRTDLPRRLRDASTHKKFARSRGRHPFQNTVDRKLQLALAAEMLSRTSVAPSVYELGSLIGSSDRPVFTTHSVGNTCRSQAKSFVVPKRRKVLVKPWRHLSIPDQVLFGCIRLAAGGEGWAFSLNLGTELLRCLRCGDPDSRDVVRNRLLRYLRKEFGRAIPFQFALELNTKGRLHVHGVLAINEADVARCTRALSAAGGKWTSKLPQRQVHFRLMTDPHIWGPYICKGLKGLSHEQQRTRVGWSRDMNQLTTKFYESLQTWAALNKDNLPISRSYRFFLGGLAEADWLDFRSVASAALEEPLRPLGITARSASHMRVQ